MSPSPRRSRWLLALAVSMMLFQAGAALNALSHSPILLQNLSLLPALEFVASALWALLFLTLAVQVWNKRHDVVRRMTWALLVWMGYSLIRIIVFARADYDRGRIPFLVVAVVTGSALILTIMLRRHHDGASSSTGVTDYDRSQD